MAYLRLRDKKAIDITQDSSGDLFTDFENTVALYFEHLNNPRWVDFIHRRFGLDDGVSHCLQDMGRFCNFTRERARQIAFIILHSLKKLLDGRELKKPKICLNPESLSRLFYKKFEEKLNDRNIITQSRVLEIIQEFSLKNSTIPYLENHLDFLMAVYGYAKHIRKNYEEQPIKFYYKNIGYEDISSMLSSIRSFLGKSYRLRSINVLMRKFKISEDDFEFYRHFLTNIQIITKNSKKYYRVPLRETLNTVIENILKSNKEPLHYKDIRMRLLKMGCIKKQDWSINSCLARSKSMVAIGKSGLWALKEWNLNISRVADILKKILNRYGKPLKSIEIYKRANKIREINSHNVSSVLNIYKDIFVHYADNSYGLVGWHLKKPRWNIIPYNKNRLFKRQEIFDSAVAILKKNDGGPIKIQQLISQMSYTASSIYSALNYYQKHFIKGRQGGRHGRTIALKSL